MQYGLSIYILPATISLLLKYLFQSEEKKKEKKKKSQMKATKNFKLLSFGEEAEEDEEEVQQVCDDVLFSFSYWDNDDIS